MTTGEKKSDVDSDNREAQKNTRRRPQPFPAVAGRFSPSSVFASEEPSKHIIYNDFTDAFISEIDYRIRCVSKISILLWIIMVCVSFAVGYKTGRLEKLVGAERLSCMIAALLLGMSYISISLPLIYRGKKRASSGVFVGALVIQSIAIFTDVMMAFVPVPVMIDPVSGSRVFLLRWSEWAPLAFMMTFMTEASDSPHSQQRSISTHDDLSPVSEQSSLDGKLRAKKIAEIAIQNASCQSLSTLCGWFFPFCPGTKSWLLLLFVSSALFLHLFYRIQIRTRAFAQLTKGESVDDIEMYQWAKLSLKLLYICTVMWSLLVILFMFYSFGPLYFTQLSSKEGGSLTMCFECAFDVLSKALFLLIIVDVHDNTFDPGSRAQRRLEELRQMMGVVWYNSSDVIGISVRNVAGDVTTSLSPTFLNIFSKNFSLHSDSMTSASSIALSVELGADIFKETGKEPIRISRKESKPGLMPKIVYGVKHDHESDTDETSHFEISSGIDLDEKEMSSVADLLIRAWKAKDGDSLIVHDLIHDNNKFRCEAKVTRMEKNALIIVVRDISERFKRFEAEKKVISETMARQKDAEANRFTRHEVKNGLLAAIGLCDSLRESLSPKNISPMLLSQLSSFCNINDKTSSDTNLNKLVHMPQDIGQCMFELDKTLREILDTILAEAMARDVIHEVYLPKLEQVNLIKVLGGTNVKVQRFPIVTKPTPLPNYALDPQLLKYIHRNAVSNACKYGKKGGVVRTEVNWDEEKSMLKMDVINFPGDGHNEILKLGDFARELVFSPRKRLPVHTNAVGKDHDPSSHSSGDGAWIVDKCAKTLGGSCNIMFEKDRSVFTFCCPATTYKDSMEFSPFNTAGFELPKNIYAVAVDDSKVQRRLLQKYFLYAGIAEDRIRILGANTSELRGFNDWVVTFIDDHPDDYFLFIIDENLDIHDDQTKHETISGSLYVSEIRHRILPEQERRMLALIRSANDSANDVAIYNSRAHGFLHKSPVKVDSVMETLAPIWLERFPQVQLVNKDTGGSKEIDNLHSGTDTLVSLQDLVRTIEKINRLSSEEEGELQGNWSVVWEMLQLIKGDLLTMPSSEETVTAIQIINSLRGPVVPVNFAEKWESICSIILKEKYD